MNLSTALSVFEYVSRRSEPKFYVASTDDQLFKEISTNLFNQRVEITRSDIDADDWDESPPGAYEEMSFAEIIKVLQEQPPNGERIISCRSLDRKVVYIHDGYLYSFDTTYGTKYRKSERYQPTVEQLNDRWWFSCTTKQADKDILPPF